MKSIVLDQGKKIIVALALLLALTTIRPHLQRYDSVGYYSWVRSLVIKGNLNIEDVFQRYKMDNFIIRTTTGNPAQPWPIGCSILWFPFFITAHAFVITINFFGWHVSTDGYSLLYRLATALGTITYATLGLLIIYDIIKNYYDATVALISVITLWLASPLIFYMFAHPMMSHSNDMFAYTLVLWAWLLSREKPSYWLTYVFLGAACGLSAMVRNQNVFLVGLIISSIGYQWLRGTITWWEGVNATTIFCLTWFLVFLPQMFVWRYTFGTWILFKQPYSFIPGAGVFYPGFPWIFNVMFSDNRGMIIWHPVLLLAIVGFYYLFEKDNLLFFFLVISFLVQLGIIGSWEQWHGARGFGQRFFVNLVPGFMLGFAALIDKVKMKVPIHVIISLCLAFIVWNFLLMLQFILDIVPRGGPTNLYLMVRNQFLVIPENLSKLFQGLITRSE